MLLSVNGSEVKQNPHHTDVRAALSPIINNSQYDVVLSSTGKEWLKATWSSSVGIKLEYGDHTSEQEFEDVTMFVSLRQTMAVFNSFAKGMDGWKSMARWKPKTSRRSLKRFIEVTTWPMRLLGVLFFLAVLILRADADITASVNNTPLIGGTFMLTGGLLMASWTVTSFVYRDEMEDDNGHASNAFLYSVFFAAFGIALLLTAFLGGG